MAPPKSEVLQGTMDLLVLKSLDTIGPMHGWGLARRLQQLSHDRLQLSQGTVYPALLRLEQRGWVTAEWGTSDNNRKARFYAITRAGRKQLKAETASWEEMAGLINRVLQGA